MAIFFFLVSKLPFTRNKKTPALTRMLMESKVLEGSLGDYLHNIVVALTFSLSINLKGK